LGRKDLQKQKWKKNEIEDGRSWTREGDWNSEYLELHGGTCSIRKPGPCEPGGGGENQTIILT